VRALDKSGARWEGREGKEECRHAVPGLTPGGEQYYPSGNSLHNYARGICHHRGEHISEPKLPD